MPELRTARENARLEIGSQRGRNSHHIGVLGIYDLQGLSYGRTELLVAGVRVEAVAHAAVLGTTGQETDHHDVGN